MAVHTTSQAMMTITATAVVSGTRFDRAFGPPPAPKTRLSPFGSRCAVAMPKTARWSVEQVGDACRREERREHDLEDDHEDHRDRALAQQRSEAEADDEADRSPRAAARAPTRP